jgi:Cu+-exporting ATPase
MEKDLICGAEIWPEYAACRSQYRGKTYFFCCPSCQHEFDSDPERWLTRAWQLSHQPDALAIW